MDLALFNNDVIAIITKSLLFDIKKSGFEKFNLSLVCKDFADKCQANDYNKIKEMYEYYCDNGSLKKEDMELYESHYTEIRKLASKLPEDKKSTEYKDILYDLKYSHCIDMMFPMIMLLRDEDCYKEKLYYDVEEEESDDEYEEGLVYHTFCCINDAFEDPIFSEETTPATKKDFINLCSSLTLEQKIAII